MLHTVPPRLRMKAGDRNVPSSKLPQMTRSRLTQAAVRHPNCSRTAMVMTFASPGLSPGRGEGMVLSSKWMLMARAVSQAIRWS